MGILRTIIILSGVTAFIPSPPEDAQQVGKNPVSSQIAEASYLQAATSTFSDLATFCERQPGVCKTAGFVAYKLELKAKYGVRLIYEWANEVNPPAPSNASPELADTTDPITTGSNRVASAEKPAVISQSTLRIEDLIPLWRGPVAPKNS